MGRGLHRLRRNRARQDGRCRLKAAARPQAKGGRQQTLRDDHGLLVVLQLETASDIVEDGDIRRHARLQGADLVRDTRHSGGIARHHGTTCCKVSPRASMELIAWVKLKRACPAKGWFSSSG